MTSARCPGRTARRGTLYGIGVGPGDARYLTLRAAGLVQAVDVVAYFAKRGPPGNARRIVAPLLIGGQAEMRLEYPVTDEVPADILDYQQKIGAFYREIGDRSGGAAATRQVGRPAGRGRSLFLWLLHAYVAPPRADFPVEVVPGVTGMSGCWTRANLPMTWGNDALAVLPGTLAEDRLVERLRLADAAVIMKVGRNLAKVRRAVETAGLLSRAVYVERGTMKDERILPLADCGEAGRLFRHGADPGRGAAAVTGSLWSSSAPVRARPSS